MFSHKPYSQGGYVFPQAIQLGGLCFPTSHTVRGLCFPTSHTVRGAMLSHKPYSQGAMFSHKPYSQGAMFSHKSYSQGGYVFPQAIQLGGYVFPQAIQFFKRTKINLKNLQFFFKMYQSFSQNIAGYMDTLFIFCNFQVNFFSYKIWRQKSKKELEIPPKS